MIIGKRDLYKLISITVVVMCAAFVCLLFLNYNLDIVSLRDKLTSEQEIFMYEAVIASGKVVVCVSGGCLILTTLVMLIFHEKNYIDSHGSELGILKAMGYSRFSVARHFWVFGISALAGSILGCALAFLYMPKFYETQNGDGLFPKLSPSFHPALVLAVLLLPAVFFSGFAVLYAHIKMKRPVMALIKDTREIKATTRRRDYAKLSFLLSLKRCTLRGKAPMFFVWFSAFCFSSMTQMSVSMKTLSSESMSIMVLSIGLILACMTVIMSLSSVVKANAKTIAMMKAFGYTKKECGGAILGCYHPVSYVGFAVGTVYRYLLLKVMVEVVFAGIDGVPEYGFDIKSAVVSLVMFVISYELIIHWYERRIEGQTLKCVIAE